MKQNLMQIAPKHKLSVQIALQRTSEAHFRLQLSILPSSLRALFLRMRSAQSKTMCFLCKCLRAKTEMLTNHANQKTAQDSQLFHCRMKSLLAKSNHQTAQSGPPFRPFIDLLYRALMKGPRLTQDESSSSSRGE